MSQGDLPVAVAGATAAETLPRPIGWPRWLAGLRSLVGPIALALTVSGDTPQQRYLFRVVDDQELAGILARRQFALREGQLEVKQFWTNITDARAFLAQLRERFDVTATRTIVQTLVTAETYALGYQFPDPVGGTQRWVISFDPVGLQAVNVDALRYGIVVRDISPGPQ